MSKNSQLLIAFAFGVVFIVAVLVIAWHRPEPSPFEYTVFRIVIALAAAGVGAILPGFLNVNFKGVLRAGGALALFVVVYFFAPAAISESGGGKVVEPPGDAKEVADAWLALVDQGQYSEAYKSMADWFRSKHPYEQFEEVIRRHRGKLGSPQPRAIHSTSSLESPPGYPKGAYRQYVLTTTFGEKRVQIYEGISLMGEGGQWRVNGFYWAVRSPSGQLVPFDPS